MTGKLTREERALLTAGGAMWETAAVGDIPPLTMADGPMGVASGRVDERDVAVLTPAPVALGASWDRELVARVGAIVGGEAARTGVDALLAPNLNLPRSPLAGRAFEYFSEDPFLTGALGRAWTEGLQSRGVGAIPKHLVCNDSETDRNSMDSVIDEAALREVYLLPFEMALEAKPAGYLMAYNRVNGTYCAEHTLLMQTIVKGEWRFDGLLVSDWFGVQDGKASARGGLDLEMPGPGRFMGSHVLPMIEEGLIGEARLDDAASRVAAVARRFAGKGVRPAETDRATLIEAAAASLVLLRNEERLLPLDPERHPKVALIGPNWEAPCYQGGTFAKIALDPETATPRQALQSALAGRCELVFAQGCLPEPILPPMPVVPRETLGDGRNRGMTVDYFDSHDFGKPPVAREVRDTNSLTWFARTAVAAVIDKAAGVRASGLFTPAEAGRYYLCVGGTGALSVLLDGREIHRDDSVYAPGDIMGRLKSGEADRIAIDFTDTAPHEIVVELRYRPGHVQGLWYGMEMPERGAAMTAEAEAAARAADVVLLMVGETSDSSVESRDRRDAGLSARQLHLIERVTAANPATVVIVNVGHAVALDFADRVPGLMLALYPGQEFAEGLAEVLTGRREPGGRLAFTIAGQDRDYPAFHLDPDGKGRLFYEEGRLIGYRSFVERGIAPRYGLGEGFGYADCTLTAAGQVSPAQVTASVSNASERAGKTVVQVYGRRCGETHVSLVGYAAAMVPARGMCRLDIPLDLRPLRRWTGSAWSPAEAADLFVGLSLAEALARGPAVA